MGSPSLPRVQPQREAPNLLDPTVMFARLRERGKATQAAGRNSTILASGMTFAQPKLTLGSAA